MAKSVIELNGQKYDSATGKLLGSSPPVNTTKKVITKPLQTAQHLDGFSRRSNATPRANTHLAPKAVHQQPQKSKTLMRTAVKKPAVPAKIHAKAPVTPSGSKKIAPKSLMSPTLPGRVIRATNTPQSNLISKFGAAAAAIKTEILPVASAPKAMNSQTLTHAPAVMPVNERSKVSPKANQFQNAIDQSTSHEQPRLKKTKLKHRVAKKLHVSPRIVSFASFTLVAMAISGFMAYQNLPELAMRVAATRAGFSASLPSYQPSGFSMAGPIQYEPGEVTVNYKSASDDRSFNVVQKNSSWNSETLLENFVAMTGKAYQTFQSNGRTIFIYDNNKATWVDGGVWYNIDGKSNLNSDQLLRIASGL